MSPFSTVGLFGTGGIYHCFSGAEFILSYAGSSVCVMIQGFFGYEIKDRVNAREKENSAPRA